MALCAVFTFHHCFTPMGRWKTDLSAQCSYLLKLCYDQFWFSEKNQPGASAVRTKIIQLCALNTSTVKLGRCALVFTSNDM